MPLEAAEIHLDDPVVGDLVLDAVVAGPDDGVPVLLLHGFPQTSLQWGRVMPPLAAAGVRAVAIDQRGYSPRARPSEPSSYAMPSLVDDVVGTIAALGWSSAHVVGHDWGAVVAWALAAERPDLVRSLTALSVPHPAAFTRALRSDPVQWRKSPYLLLFRRSPSLAARMLRRGDSLRKVYAGAVAEPDVDRYVELFTEPGVLESALQWYAANGDVSGVGPVSVPTTFVWGTDDVAVGARAARECGQECRGEYEMRVLTGRGHWLADEDPDAVVDAILARIA